jgi:hypothetical protein
MQRSPTTYVLYAKSLKNREILHNAELRNSGTLCNIGTELIRDVWNTQHA